jgi:RNA polymerase sigma-70 factor (ECF subfamily)
MALDWNQLVREQGPLVYRTAYRILGHVADTEDVFQEVFLEAHQMRGEVRSWPGLLRRLAACRALDRLRQRRQRPFVAFDDAIAPAQADAAADELIGKELAERLREAVSRLPTQEAAVFCLRYFEELSNVEIAEALDTTPGAVAVALHKARCKLESAFLPTDGRGASK